MRFTLRKRRPAEDANGGGGTPQPTTPDQTSEWLRSYMIASELDDTPTSSLAAVIERANQLGYADPVIRVHQWLPGSLLASDSEIRWKPLSEVLHDEKDCIP